MLDALEIFAVGCNVVYVILAARENIWCWPFGIIGSLLSIWLFIDTQLYAESVLFTYYVIMGFYGWYQWSGKRTATDTLKIKEWPWKMHIVFLLIGYTCTFLLFLILRHFTDAQMPLLDSFTTIFSFIATWMTARRVIENWIYWIAINGLTVYLYLSRGLDVYALLSVIYVGMALYGFWNWKKDFANQRAKK